MLSSKFNFVYEIFSHYRPRYCNQMAQNLISTWSWKVIRFVWILSAQRSQSSSIIFNKSNKNILSRNIKSPNIVWLVE